jgi:tetratricopeptide (TPR) repeat protein
MKMLPGKSLKSEESNSIANCLNSLQFFSAMKHRWCLRSVLAAMVVLSSTLPVTAGGQQSSSTRSDGIEIHGTVRNATNEFVDGAVVRLEQMDVPDVIEIRTNPSGAFSFSRLHAGSYNLSAEKSGQHSRAAVVIVASVGEQRQVDLILEESRVPQKDSSAGASSFGQVMEFADKPNFTVAGVTDWTAVGGHGSDSTLRTSEALARETLTLRSETTEHNGDDVGSTEDASGKSIRATADDHRLAGKLDEKKGDPLAAVREFEQAVHLDPSEENYFEWGSELLLHRAVWQAQAVFQKGAEAYPKSARMLTGLGTALFAGARYDEAAQRLCDASDLNPASVEPYIFMGKIEMAAPDPLACIEHKLEWFAEKHSDNSQANYLYAMAILKRHEQSPDAQITQQAEALLEKAVQFDGKCGEAYLQLGILSASRRDYQKAIGLYTKAIEANPQMSEAHYRLGVAYDRVGEHDKARQEFQLHDEFKKRESEAIDRQRREVKQFLVVLPGQPSDSPVR